MLLLARASPRFRALSVCRSRVTVGEGTDSVTRIILPPVEQAAGQTAQDARYGGHVGISFAGCCREKCSDRSISRLETAGQGQDQPPFMLHLDLAGQTTPGAQDWKHWNRESPSI